MKSSAPGRRRATENHINMSTITAHQPFPAVVTAAASPDRELLEQFIATRSDDAFGQLVTRYAGLVQSAARRQVRDATIADDVTQAVFIVLARRAASIDPPALPAWLIKTTYFTAKDALRLESRRK